MGSSCEGCGDEAGKRVEIIKGVVRCVGHKFVSDCFCLNQEYYEEK